MSSPTMNNIILAGCIISYIAVFVEATEEKDNIVVMCTVSCVKSYKIYFIKKQPSCFCTYFDCNISPTLSMVETSMKVNLERIK